MMGGDLRLITFDTKSYVNQLRRLVEAATSSQSFEWRASELADLAGCSFFPPCAQIKDSLQLSFRGALLRVEYSLDILAAEWELTVDGITTVIETPPAISENDYRLHTIHLPEGEHILSMKVNYGTACLYRIESYSGQVAVINSGVGSCPTFSYRSKYWDSHIAAAKPDIVLAEAHTINDWLSGDSPRVYRQNLAQLLRDYRQLGAVPVLMTVCPIGGFQTFPNTAATYDEFVSASRLAAKDTGAVLCDANAVFKLMLENLTPEQAATYVLDDNWHPNDRGHAIYAALLAQCLGQHLELPLFLPEQL